MPTRPDPRRERGQAAEELAAAYLRLEGWVILGRNLRAAGVEVDLLARCGDLLVLVEVKLRRSGLVPASGALGPEQWRRQRRAARALLSHAAWAQGVRIDLVAVDRDAEGLRLRHLRGVTAV